MYTNKKDLKERKELLPYDVLGRSLSQAAFFPTDLKALLEGIEKPLIMLSDNEDIEVLKQADLIISSKGLDEISMLKRYTNKPLLFKDDFFDEYQLLEALVYGADGVFFAKGFSKKLVDFAHHLGLFAAIRVDGKIALLKAVAADFDIFFAAKKLLSALPEGKIGLEL